MMIDPHDEDEILKFVLTDPKGATKLIMQLFDIVEQQGQKIKELEARIENLEAQLNKNSQNSSFPPSRDIYNPKKKSGKNPGKKNRNNSLRKKTGRKVGGQKNHPGKTLEQSPNPDELHNIEVNTCSCGHDLSLFKADGYIRRQIFELPPVNIHITEFKAEVKRCPICGCRNTGIFPEHVTQSVQFGENLKAHALYDKNLIFSSYDNLKTKFVDFYRHSLSPATIIGFEKKAYSHLEQFEQELKRELIKSPVLNADETGLKVMGDRWWLHSIGDERMTLYGVHPKRGSVATNEIGVLPQYEGILVHDFWGAYAKYHCDHSYCNAHIMRELQGIVDGYKQEWAVKMKALFEQIYCYLFIEDKRDSDDIFKFREKYTEILEEGFYENPPPDDSKRKGKRGRIKKTKPLNLLTRLRDYSDDILRFMYNSIVPFTNNLAERDVRMMKVRQKISGTFRSIDGAERFCRMRCYISTARKCGKSVFEALLKLARGNPYTLQELIG
jgi:transposase